MPDAKTISDTHMSMLLSAAITSDVAIGGGVHTALTVEQLPEVFREWPGMRAVPGLVFPWRGFAGDVVYQVRPDKAIVKADETEAKYVFAKDTEMVLHVHPFMDELVRDRDIPLVITEGTKQTLAAVSALIGGKDYAVVGMPGCYGWSQKRRQIADLKSLATVLRGRKVVLIFDADWTTNRNVWEAANGLTDLLKLHGVASIGYVTVPGGSSTGLDDALADTVDPAASIRDLIADASKGLGRPPRKSQASAFFDEDGSLLTEKAAEGLLKDYPSALAMDGTVAIYEAGRYVIDNHQQAFFSAVGDLLGDKYRPSSRQAISEFVQGRLFADRRRLSDRPNTEWLNLRNGMLDLDTLELHPHDPELLSTVQLPIRWDPEATCPTYDEWVRQVAGEEQLVQLEQTTSQMLEPGLTPSKSLFCFGPSRSGKSTFLRIMRAVMGEENTSSVTLHALSDDRFASANLYGKALNVAADLSSAHVQDLSTWKMLTGEDPVQANRKHGAQFSFVNRALFAFSANEPPTVGESSRAYFSRIIPVKFGTSFEGAEDASIEHRIVHSELPGVLRRWVEARLARKSVGRFATPSAAVLAEFEAASDRVALWLGEEMVVVRAVPGPDGQLLAVLPEQTLPTTFGATLTDLHAEFQEWAKGSGYGGLGRNKFGERLTRQDGVLKIRIGKGAKNQRGLNVIKRQDDEDPSVGSLGNSQSTTAIAEMEKTGGKDQFRYGDSASKTAKTANDHASHVEDDRHAPSTTQSYDAPEQTAELTIVRADVDDLTVWVYDAIAADPAKATEGSVRAALRISQTEYKAARDYLISHGVIAKRTRGFELLGKLVQQAAPYAPLADMHFVNRPDGSVPMRALLVVEPRPCPECGEPTDDPDSYFPFCAHHRREAS